MEICKRDGSVLGYHLTGQREWKRNCDNYCKCNTGTGRTAVFRVVPNGVKTQEIEIIQGNSYIPTTDGEFPIIAWTGVEADKSLEKFPVMKASGINIYLGWYDDLETTLKVLDAAQKTGVK